MASLLRPRSAEEIAEWKKTVWEKPELIISYFTEMENVEKEANMITLTSEGPTRVAKAKVLYDRVINAEIRQVRSIDE